VRSRGSKIILIMSGSILALGGAAHAQEARKDDKKQAESRATQVVVEGKRKEAVDRIDRRVYDVKSDPEAQSGVASDILGKLPSVQISPTGAVSLRGDGRVLVLVDGKYPANGNAVIQTIQGANIDRIEVMTNPSAEYAADAPGGIINIITRKRNPLGLSGSLAARTGNVNSNVNASAVFTGGGWTVDTRFIYSRSHRNWNQTVEKAAPDAFTDDGHFDANFEGVVATANVTYKFDDKRSLAFDAEGHTSWMWPYAVTHYRSDTLAYDELAHTAQRDSYAYAELIYEDNNADLGHHLTIDTWHTDYDTLSRNSYIESYLMPAGGEKVYTQRTRTQGPEDDIKIDYERTLKSGDLLTAGTEWLRRESDIETLYSDSGSVPGPYPDGTTQTFTGRRATLDAYLTWQHDFGKWTVLPGLRVEDEKIDTDSQGISDTSDVLHWQPSLHLSHALGKGKIRISYARKLERTDISQYNPAIVYYSSNSAQQGNPDIKAPQTDSYEAGYDFNKGGALASFTVYYRRTFDLVSEVSEDTGNNLILTRYLNSGQSSNGGAELTLKAPLPHGFKYSLGANLFYQNMPYYNGVQGATHGQATYTGNGMLEYDSKAGDQYQVMLGLTGRQLTVQGYNAATSHLDLTWQHPITKKVSLVMSVTNLLLGQDRVAVYDTPSFRGRSTQIDNDRWYRVALSWKFGGPN